MLFQHANQIADRPESFLELFSRCFRQFLSTSCNPPSSGDPKKSYVALTESKLILDFIDALNPGLKRYRATDQMDGEL